jgi:hypothetical protein
VSLARTAKRRDANESEIIAALEAVGVHVWQLDRPCDLLTFRLGRWQPLEVKMPHAHPRKDQAEQQEFLALTKVPVVRSIDDALRAVGAIR